MKIAFRKLSWWNPIDLVIALFSWGRYVHVELVFSNNVSYSSEPFKGTRFKDIKFDTGKWSFYDVGLPVGDEKVMWLFCEREKGCGYDWMGIFAFIVPWCHNSKTRWFCSEVVIAAFQSVDLLTCLDKNKTDPTDLYEALQTRGLGCRVLSGETYKDDKQKGV